MNKQELRDSYLDKGFTVKPVDEWRKIDTIDNRTKFDVNFIKPNGTTVDTAYIIVENDGTPQENVVATARIDEPEAETTFAERLRAHIRALEKGPLFATAVDQVFQDDGVAIVNAYFGDGGVKQYVVKERNDAFTHQEIATALPGA